MYAHTHTQREYTQEAAKPGLCKQQHWCLKFYGHSKNIKNLGKAHEASLAQKSIEDTGKAHDASLAQKSRNHHKQSKGTDKAGTGKV